MKIARAYKIFFLLLLISFIFLIGNFSPSPFYKINRYLTLPLRHLKYSISDIENLEAENKRLKEIVSLYEIERIKLREILKENENLRKRLRLTVPPPEWKVILAEITEVYSREIVLDKGIADGVEEGMPVISADILVGRISKLWQNKAIAILLTHSDFSVGVKIVNRDLEGVGEGIPLENIIQLKYIPKESNIKQGDEIITSGRGGIYPSGLKVGKVMKVVSEPFGFFLKVEVRPALKISEVQDVAILIKR